MPEAADGYVKYNNAFFLPEATTCRRDSRRRSRSVAYPSEHGDARSDDRVHRDAERHVPARHPELEAWPVAGAVVRDVPERVRRVP